ncbi:Scd6-like Sm domain-containing protein [Pseudomassariella vexata]|uniref:Scd6-like Sm domain-domain-containing protein n=1 Tax=Pseudomassariella vexata TaxID=1141098 RepID=A0A1Y2DBU2_9PEZI|nr:Scd6-like Sm domain-containing protein [Pseudomassariella vexata]ORY56135.1 Scd6-like Sm domain-domain-containing protein [Pseudomassariella vexata]
MSEFLGSRISLISKSDIRYSGVLHEINSEESTVSLENVRSYGTEGRRGKPDEELPPSDQVYEYIVFRGSDVKDLRIEEGPAAKENKPPAVPDDPAIVGARARATGPSAATPGPNHPQGAPGAPGFNQPPFPQSNFYPPGPGGPWGRGGGPGPGPDPRFGGMPYPPPPGWFPPGQGFPPGAPGPWNNFGYPPGPHGHPGAPNAPGGLGGLGGPGAPGQGMRGTPQQDMKPTPIGAGAAPGSDKPRSAGTPAQAEQSAELQPFAQPPVQQPSSAHAPTPPVAPVESKPSVEEVKATSQSLSNNTPAKAPQQPRNMPTGPRSNRVTPAVPVIPAILSRPAPAQQPQVTAAAAAVKPVATESPNGPVSAATIRDATQQAKAAVAVAMAKLDATASGVSAPPGNGTGSAMDNLTKKVNEMRVNAARTGPSNRGRGRGNRAGGPAKVDVPDSDFDFQGANAKFNKQDLVKEAIAGSPLGEAPNGAPSEPQDLVDPAQPPQAYNKTKSFFDNISSEAKDRADSGGQKPGGREWRGEEQRKNMETFGQGSVDGGYRPNYRGRGRGRGRGGRGYGQTRGGGFRPRGDSQGVPQ